MCHFPTTAVRPACRIASLIASLQKHFSAKQTNPTSENYAPRRASALTTASRRPAVLIPLPSSGPSPSDRLTVSRLNPGSRHTSEKYGSSFALPCHRRKCLPASLCATRPHNKTAFFRNETKPKSEIYDARQCAILALTVLDLFKEGRIRPLISQKPPLEQARRAHETLGEGSVPGKIVLLPNF